MLHRIRLAMQDERRRRQARRRSRSGRNLHRRQSAQHARASASGSACRKAQLDGWQGRRHGPAGAPRRRAAARSALQGRRRAASAATSSQVSTRNVEKGATVHTDALRSYQGLRDGLRPQRHRPRRGVRGRASSHERLENFWSLLKRALKGTYVSRRTVPPVPLSRRTGVPVQQPHGHERRGPLQRWS